MDRHRLNFYKKNSFLLFKNDFCIVLKKHINYSIFFFLIKNKKYFSRKYESKLFINSYKFFFYKKIKISCLFNKLNQINFIYF